MTVVTEEWSLATKLVTAKPSLKVRWRKEVLRSSRITDSVRVLLLVLAEHMDERGHVSKPRSWLAEVLNRSETRISERLKAAVAAGFLDRVARGHKGRTAIYAATLPDHREE